MHTLSMGTEMEVTLSMISGKSDTSINVRNCECVIAGYNPVYGIIGKYFGPHIVLDKEDTMISRQHFFFTIEDEKSFIVDLST